MQDSVSPGGTDGPLGDMDPFHGMGCAVTRQSFDGKTVVNPQECIDVFSAVKMFTANAARVGHEERIKGTLEPGKLADFIILNMDIFRLILRKSVKSVLFRPIWEVSHCTNNPACIS